MVMSQKQHIQNLLQLAKAIKHGDWLFTCSMQPQQFNEFDKRDPERYDKEAWGKAEDFEREQFFNYDNFTTIGGASHSSKNCGLKPISEKYAKWFIEHKVWERFDKHKDTGDAFSYYLQEVKDLCIEHNIEFEGI